MAVHQKLSEIGWFYHAPAPKRENKPAEAPLASQIPGLNDLSSIPYNDEPRSMYRDTDTKYIRLAKRGGREDLLQFREPKEKSKEPAAYPRNDWFYLEDNRMENHEQAAAPKNPWEFRLPEYMVHDEHRPYGDDYDYKNDPEGLVYWKKGRVAPGGKEIKRVSRNPPPTQLPVTAPLPSKPSTVNKPKSQDQNTKYPAVPQLYDPEARPAMNKLLAYGYQNEWQSARDGWYQDLRMLEDQARHEARQEHEKQASSKKGRTTMTWDDMTKNRNQVQPVNASRRVGSNTRQQEEKQMFKLSKFENVAPRVGSHRILPPISNGV